MYGLDAYTSRYLKETLGVHDSLELKQVLSRILYKVRYEKSSPISRRCDSFYLI